MVPRTTPAVASDSTGNASIRDLLDRAGDLKGELVAFAQRPRFRKSLDVLLRDAASRH